MTRTHKTAVLAAMFAFAGVAMTCIGARAQVVTPPPDQLRFETVLSEPIAAPGSRGVMAGTSAMLVRDRATGQCFLAVTIGDSMGLSPAACQPPP